MIGFFLGISFLVTGLLVARAQRGVFRPIPALLLTNGATLTLNGTGLLHIRVFSASAALLVFLFMGVFLASYSVRIPARQRVLPQGHQEFSPSDLLSCHPSVLARFLGIGLTGATVLGVVFFRRAIEAAAGQPLASLTPVQVRYYQVHESLGASSGSFLLALGSLAAVVNYLAFKGAVARVGGAGLPLLACFQTPSRTTAFNAVLVFAACLVSLHRRSLAPHLGGSWRLSRGGAVLAVSALAGGFVAYFISVGSDLHKVGMNSQVSVLPPGIESLALYLAAPWSALSVGLSGAPGTPGPEAVSHIYWVVWKLANLGGVVPSAPVMPAGFVNVPIPFNTYSWVGDLYFSSGLVVGLLGTALMGLLVSMFDRSFTSSPSLRGVWSNAVLTGVMLASFSGLRFFILDTVVLLIAGRLVLPWVWLAGVRGNALPAQKVSHVRPSVTYCQGNVRHRPGLECQACAGPARRAAATTSWP
jgi:hypothetical protein